MTHVTLTRTFKKQLDRVPDYIQVKVHEWIFAVSKVEIAEVMKRPGYHDEPLKGDRRGH